MHDELLLGPFELGEPVQEGGMAVIHRAIHRYSGEVAAIKIIKPDLLYDDSRRRALQKEIQTIAGLDHPNIVRLFDVGEISAEVSAASGGQLPAGAPWYAMEYIDGGSMLEAPPAAGWQQVKALIMELLDALAHAHASDIIHRDIKPGNVLLANTPDGTSRVKLVDFGIAQLLSSLEFEEFGERTSEYHVSGTPKYMAPEQVSGRHREQGPWTDLYALGCLTWYLTTGEPPFRGALIDVMRAHIYEPLPRLDALFPVPAELERWLAQIMAKSTHDRFRRAADAARALYQLEDPDPYADEDDETMVFELPSLTMLDGATTRTLTTTSDASLQTLSFLGDQTSRSASTASTASKDTSALPPTWSRPDDNTPISRTAASLGLFGLRPPPLVGRVSERDELWGALQEVIDTQQLRAVIISGDQGSGTSRLAQWLLRRAHESGACTNLWVRCEHQGSGMDALRDMLVSALRCNGLAGEDLTRYLHRTLCDDPLIQLPEERLEQVVRLLSPPRQDNAHYDPTVVRDLGRRHELITELLGCMARERPLILCFDDVHWGADALQLIDHITRHGAQLPLLCMCTVSADELGALPLTRQLITDLSARDRTQLISLPPLSREEHSAFVDALLPFEPRLAQRLIERTEGRPDFALRLVEDWIQRGVLTQAPEGFILSPGSREVLPTSLQEVWRRRLRRMLGELDGGLRADAQRALELAATLGRNVKDEEWRVACMFSNVIAPTTLVDKLARDRLITQNADGWAFIHTLLREELLLEATAHKRLPLHHAHCVSMLETIYLDTVPELTLRRAHHTLGAHRAEAAEKLYLDAARQFARCSETSRALDALEERERIIEELDAGLRSPRWSSNQLEIIQLELDLQRLHSVRARLDEFDKVNPDIEQHPRTKQRSRYENIRLRLRIADGRLARAVASRDEILHACQNYPDDPLLTSTLRHTARAHFLTGDLALARHLYEICQARFVAHGDRIGYGISSLGVAKCDRALGELDLAETTMLDAITIFREDGYHAGLTKCLFVQASIARQRGQLRYFDELINVATQYIEQLDGPVIAHCLLVQLIFALLDHDIDRATELTAELQQLSDALEFHDSITFQLARAALHALEGATQRCATQFAIARAGLKQSGVRSADVALLTELIAENLAGPLGESATRLAQKLLPGAPT